MIDQPILQTRLVLASRLELLPQVRDLIESSALQAGFHETDTQRVVTAAYEAVANAVTHGSPLGQRNTIWVAVSVYDDRMVVEVTDQGPGFQDPIRWKMPDTSSSRGRGIPLMRSLMDEIELENVEGGRVRLTKFRK